MTSELFHNLSFRLPQLSLCPHSIVRPRPHRPGGRPAASPSPARGPRAPGGTLEIDFSAYSFGIKCISLWTAGLWGHPWETLCLPCSILPYLWITISMTVPEKTKEVSQSERRDRWAAIYSNSNAPRRPSRRVRTCCGAG